MASSASISYIHQKLKWHMLIYYFQRYINAKCDHGALAHPQRPRQAQLWRAQQVPIMFIKNLLNTCLYAIFQRQSI